MTYKGRVEEGVIVLDEPVRLDNGTEVDVEVTAHPVEPPAPGEYFERYRSFLGVLDDMPRDWAENHDKYLREQHGA